MAEKYQTREERRKQLAAKNKQKGKKKPKGTLKKIFISLIVLGILGMFAGAATFAYMIRDTPKLDEKLLKDPISSEIYDKNGNFVTEVGSTNRDYVAYDDIPKVLENAFLATEDVRFYKHHGIDLIRLGGAVVANITNGFGSEGASTITQQVVKNSFLSPEKTLSRKAQEAWLAFQLEQKYTKQEIFEMYVNKVFMSENSNGVATAAKIYFGKDVKDLTLPEAALLAGMPQSPNNYNPFKFPENAEKRRNIVLSLMNQNGFITKKEMEEAQKTPVTSSLVKEEDRKKDNKPFGSFVDQVIDEVEKSGDYDIFSDGLKIYTSLDPDAQTYVEKMLNSNEIVQFPDEKFQAGITLLDTKTGEIRAIGGGRNQNVQRGFNHATDIRRQPGSTIKPILDYGPAIEYLKWGTYYPLEDKPIKYSNGTEVNNWDNKYMGTMSMREALARSRNIPAIQAIQQVGTDKAKVFAENLGIRLNEIFESYAIGGLKEGVSPLQMAGAYSAFGNNGFYTEPHAVVKIELRDGTKIDTAPESKVAMNDYTAFMITDMLKSVVTSPYGTGQMANVPGLPVAGKTGTTNYSDAQMRAWDITDKGAVPDAWFTGYTTNYTASVWTGYDDQKNYIPTGNNQKIAQLLFKNLMQNVSKNVNTPDFPMPKSVVQVKVEKGTMPAKLASDYTPKNQIIYEYAVKGNTPKQVSKRYDKLAAPGNVAANYNQGSNEINLSWSYNDTNNVQFQVSASVNGGPDQQIAVTAEKGLSISNAVPGGLYTFKVTAINGSQQSDPATTTIKIPDPNQSGEGDDEKDKKNEGEQNGGDDKDKKNEGQQGNPNGNNGKQGNNGNDQGNNGDNGQGAGNNPAGTAPGTTNPPGSGTAPGNGNAPAGGIPPVGGGDGDSTEKTAEVKNN